MNEMKLWTWAPVAQGMEVVAVVEEDTGEIRIDLKEPERVLPQAILRMDKAVAKILAAGIMAVVLGGCSTLGRYCDETRVDLQYSHISHPFAGAPFGPKEEEDAVHTVGPMGRCTVGRGYVDIGVGYKLHESGFYGPDLTGSVNVGVTLWSSSR